jgi:dTDP-4-dehydrorhamnose 3,5-epimerase
MKVTEQEIPGVYVIDPDIFKDDRGHFFESFNDKQFRELVCNTTFVQDNESKSRAGVIRGLHWQKPPFAQSKLVRVVKGAVYDVAVDIRKGSPTFGKFVGVFLTEDNHKQFFIPRGFAHGFIALKDDTIFQYKCDNPYDKESEAALDWNSVGIDWGNAYDGAIILSKKDCCHPTWGDIDENNLFDYNIDYYAEN